MPDDESVDSVVEFLNLIKKRQRSNLEKFRRNMTMWITVSRQVFLIIEEPLFREMIMDLNVEADEMLPKSVTTIRGWIVNEFEKQK